MVLILAFRGRGFLDPGLLAFGDYRQGRAPHRNTDRRGLFDRWLGYAPDPPPQSLDGRSIFLCRGALFLWLELWADVCPGEHGHC